MTRPNGGVPAVRRGGRIGEGQWDARWRLTYETRDVLVHTWDLARAVGADDHLNPAPVTSVAPVPAATWSVISKRDTAFDIVFESRFISGLRVRERPV
ncbi:hypothetical protein [Mycobacterium sp.]|uniref:hypothetical protein n=1 Tax=Mycobacterium sp. TaxID=1785 RepID=UPI002C5F7F97|nr:hypothetical protein [Mycobacterium sp.]HTY31654.1 hypothetical protein [Mycobacterium sp.]